MRTSFLEWTSYVRRRDGVLSQAYGGGAFCLVVQLTNNLWNLKCKRKSQKEEGLRLWKTPATSVGNVDHSLLEDKNFHELGELYHFCLTGGSITVGHLGPQFVQRLY